MEDKKFSKRIEKYNGKNIFKFNKNMNINIIY